MESKTEWRCPYCDALNDWQDQVCQICGDGTRDEAEKAEKKPVYTAPETTYTAPEPPKKTEPVYMAPKTTDTVPESPKKTEPVYTAPKSEATTEIPKKQAVFWPKLILPVICVAIMIGSYAAGIVEKDKTLFWFGLMGVYCLVNAGYLFLESGLCKVAKWYLEAFALLGGAFAFASGDPQLRRMLDGGSDMVMFIVIVVSFVVPTLNLWLSSDKRKNR